MSAQAGSTSLEPERREGVATVGIEAMFCGALISWLTATIAGLLL